MIGTTEHFIKILEDIKDQNESLRKENKELKDSLNKYQEELAKVGRRNETLSSLLIIAEERIKSLEK